MSIADRLGLVTVCTLLGGLVGVVMICAINLIADPLGLPGGRGPWVDVAAVGLRFGLVGGFVGGVFGSIGAM